MTIVYICFLRFVLDIEVQKNVLVSSMMVIGIKMTNSVIEVTTWSYAAEILPSNLRGIGSGIAIYIAKITAISAPQ